MRAFKKGQRVELNKPHARKMEIKGWTGTVLMNRLPDVAWVVMDQDLPEHLRIPDHPEEPRRILLAATECRAVKA